jgi:integrase
MGLATKAFAAYLAEKHVPNFGEGRPDQALVADVLAYYGNAKAAKATCPDALARAMLNLGEFFIGKTVNDITQALCESYVEWRSTKSKRQLNPATVRNDLIVLQAAIRYCWKSRKLTQIVPIHKPKASEPRPRMLTTSEAAGLLAGALGWDQHGRRHHHRINRHVARFILTGLYTGTRHDRMLRLQWVENLQGGWVDLAKGWLHRKGAAEPVTNKRAPSVPLGNRLQQHMRRWRKLTSRHLIEYNGKNIGDIAAAFESVCELAGLATDDPALKVTPHTLRHTCASWMLAAGKTPFQVGQYLGMSAAMVEKVYAHTTDDLQRETANSIGARTISRTSHNSATQRHERA